MTDTQHGTTTDQIAHLDFQPPCEVEDYSSDNGGKPKCPNPAAWVGIKPCGHSSYFCDPHHIDQRKFKCLECSMKDIHLATCKWVRL